MSLAELVILSVTVEGRAKSEVARDYSSSTPPGLPTHRQTTRTPTSKSL